jgi:large subunit ribosomal protein L16
MLIPKKVKHRKWHKGRARNIRKATDKIEVSFGSFGLKATSPAWVTSRQIEAVRRVLTRYTKRGGKIWIRIFPDKPITKRPPESTLGGGKGTVDHYVFPVKPGRIIYEIDGVSREIATQALKLAGYKMPFKTKVIVKE